MSGSDPNAVEWRPDVPAIVKRLRPVMDRMEAMRLHARSGHQLGLLLLGLCMLVGVLCIAFLGGGANPAPLPGFVMFGLFTLLGGILYYQMGRKRLKNYRHQFKGTVFRHAVREVAPGLEYHPWQKISRGVFERSGLYRGSIDHYNGEDCFQGTVGATKISFSELHVQRVEGSGKDRRTVTVFQGIFMVADFHKHFRCTMTIEPDFAEAAFGFLGRSLQKLSGNLLRFENPDFERAFKVRGSDPVEARYILTPDMQERFLALRRNWPSGLRAAFRDSSLILAIPKTSNWFEVDANSPANDPEHLRRFFNQLLPLLFIPTQLDLNTRIWTKD